MTCGSSATTAANAATARSANCRSTGRAPPSCTGTTGPRRRSTFAGEWTRSGDKYTRDADGYYTYGGRSDDMLKVGGIYVSPFEVEACLMTHAAVLEAAVIGAADTDELVKPKAYVVLKPGQAATRGRTAAARQEPARAVQVPALDPVRARTAQDRDRQDPALQAAGPRSRPAAPARPERAAANPGNPWCALRARVENA